jgi:hypothetical protein
VQVLAVRRAGSGGGGLVKIVLDVPDGERLQLLADALTESAAMRMRAAGRAAREVQADTAIPDKRPHATRLLAVVADAEWIRQVADALPLLVVEDAPPAQPTAGPPPPPPAAPGPGPVPAATFTPPAATAATPAGGVPDYDDAAKAAIRALTVPPGARLTPGAPAVPIDGPPEALVVLAAQQAAAESLADIAEFGDEG